MHDTLILSGYFGFICLLAVYDYFHENGSLQEPFWKQWPTNFAFFIFNIGLSGVIPFSGAASSMWAYDHHIGLLAAAQLPVIVEIPIWALCVSLLVYLVHLANHHFKFLWSMHQTHHSDTALDTFTGFRHHPGELIISIIQFSLLALVVGASPTTVMIWGLLESAMDFFTHSRFRFPPSIENILRQIFVTPDIHRLHHSNFVSETNSNYGTSLIIWDRIFGTYLPASSRPAAAFKPGLDSMTEEQSHDFGWLMIAPLQRPYHAVKLLLRQYQNRQNRVE